MRVPQVSGLMLANHTSIAQLFEATCKQFDRMFQKEVCSSTPPQHLFNTSSTTNPRRHLHSFAPHLCVCFTTIIIVVTLTLLLSHTTPLSLSSSLTLSLSLSLSHTHTHTHFCSALQNRTHARTLTHAYACAHTHTHTGTTFQHSRKFPLALFTHLRGPSRLCVFRPVCMCVSE